MDIMANVHIEVKRIEKNKFDVYIDTDNSSGHEYKNINSDQIGNQVADLISCLNDAQEDN